MARGQNIWLEQAIDLLFSPDRSTFGLECFGIPGFFFEATKKRPEDPSAFSSQHSAFSPEM
jgi:hypothetical protein